jgi:hypothetical protein
MVSNTGNGIERAEMSRIARVEHVGQAALVISILALASAVFPETREMAWMPALPAVVIAVCVLGMGVGRKRYATAALMLGWFSFAYSFALMLWG